MWQLTASLGKLRGSSWPISTEPLLVGRSDQCDVIIRDPFVSRTHCRIVQNDDEIFLEDSDSRNTSLVNGRSVTHCELRMGDELVVGSATFIITRGGAAGEVESSAAGDESTIWEVARVPVQNDVVPEESRLERKPRNVRDLSLLHQLSEKLAACRSTAEVVDVIESFVLESVRGVAVHVVPHSAKSEIHDYASAHRIDEEFQSKLTECAESGSDFLAPLRSDDGEDFSVPGGFLGIRTLGETIGTVGIRWKNEEDDAASEFRFLKCVVDTAAPFLNAVSRRSVSPSSPDPGASFDPAASIFVGVSAAAEKVRHLTTVAASASMPVLIQGETGTGKELVATLLHELSDRKEKPLVAVNCAAVPEELFESEFFGHTKGAFTSSVGSKKGFLCEADGGVLMLDEVGDLSHASQASLLRVLESGRVRPLGANQDVTIDIMVVSASNTDLMDAVRRNQFRSDLYYRLNGIEIQIPPLRERPDDIPALALHFAQEFATERSLEVPGLGTRELEYLSSLPWLGNARELRNLVHQSVVLADGPDISLESLQSLVKPAVEMDVPGRSIHDVEAQHIEHVLDSCGWNFTKAAAVLGLHRNTLRHKIRRYGLDSR